MWRAIPPCAAVRQRDQQATNGAGGVCVVVSKERNGTGGTRQYIRGAGLQVEGGGSGTVTKRGERMRGEGVRRREGHRHFAGELSCLATDPPPYPPLAFTAKSPHTPPHNPPSPKGKGAKSLWRKSPDRYRVVLYGTLIFVLPLVLRGEGGYRMQQVASERITTNLFIVRVRKNVEKALRKLNRRTEVENILDLTEWEGNSF